ncbi:hypothetical protein SNB01_03855, partial [Escherichia coli]|nr:hypothetical protein [Escherichia coli]
RTSDGNGSHWSTSKTPSYTKSVSWQHHRPVLVPELGLVVVKPGRESMPVFHNTRVLVEPEPKSMRNL